MALVQCPRCGSPLADATTDKAHRYLECPKCKGAAFKLETLCLLLDPGFVVKLADLAKRAGKPGRRFCPSCRQGMVIVHPVNPRGDFDLDVCNGCGLVWFDPGELAETPSRVDELPDIFDFQDPRYAQAHPVAYWTWVAYVIAGGGSYWFFWRYGPDGPGGTLVGVAAAGGIMMIIRSLF